MLIVCPHCLKTNRVPDARLGDEPTCGQHPDAAAHEGVKRQPGATQASQIVAWVGSSGG